MSLAKNLLSKRYLFRLVLWITATLLLTIGLFSAVLYFTSRSIFMRNEFNYSSNILSQMKYNIELMDTNIKNLCRYLYLSQDVTLVANNHDNIDIRDITLSMNKLNVITGNATPFVDSICIYNGYMNQYFYGGKELFFNDEGLKKIIESYPDIPRLTPICRTITVNYGSKSESASVFSYIMYETSANREKIDNAVIVNVKVDWLLKNLRMINLIENYNDSGNYIYVLDRNGNFIENEGDSEKLKASLKSEYLRYRSGSSSTKGIFESNLLGTKYVVTFLDIDEAGFKLLKIQPYSRAYSFVGYLKIATVAATCIFLIFALFISLTVSRRLYEPLGKLVTSVASNNREENIKEFKDEISYLSDVYRYSMEKLTGYDKAMHQYKWFLRTNNLKKLLAGMDEVDEERYERIKSENSLMLTYNGPYVVCVLKIDNFTDFQKTNDMKDRELVRYAIVNISSELLLRKFTVEGVDMDEDHIALIICIEDRQEDYLQYMEEALNEARKHMSQYFGVTMTASVSVKGENMKDVSGLYDYALNNSAYRLVFGRASVITPEKVGTNLKNRHAVNFENVERRIAELINVRNVSGLEKLFGSMTAEFKMMEYDTVIIQLVRFIDSIKKAAEEQLKSCNELVSWHFPFSSRFVFEYETIEEIMKEILVSVRDVLDQISPEEETNSRNQIVAETARDIIEKNYKDKALCLVQVASIMKISARRLSKIFKEYTQTSLPEYINEVRLAKAIEWIEKYNLTISETADRVGIESETYFYYMFKKKYGTSPKEYVLRKNLTKLS